MSPSESVHVPFIESVFHPSDFSGASENAFAHALAIALRRRTRFTILHVEPEDAAIDIWTNFPPVRTTLQRWGMLDEGSPRSAVFDELGISVKKVNLRHDDVLKAVTRFLDKEPTDLIVLTTEARQAVPRWIQRSVAQQLARKTKTMTLFVPDSTRGFVSVEDGSITLKRILVAVDHKPDPRKAVVVAGRAAGMVGDAVKVCLLHVGSAGAGAPSIDLPAVANCSWHEIQREGDIVEQISAAAEEESADLIVMATHGSHGILDALRGSVTEKVLRQVTCPLLAVPSD